MAGRTTLTALASYVIKGRGTLLFGILRVAFGDVGGPGHAGFGLILDGFSRNRWNSDEGVATRALDLPAGKLLVTGQMLFAVRTLKF